MRKPLVSIIVRTKDRPILLRKALQSLAAQTYRPIEVVLVNDGGSDLDIEEIKSILGDISLSYERLDKNAGRAHAGNIGIARAKGEFLGFLDDDDLFYKDHISVLIDILQKYDYRVAYTDANIVFLDFDPDSSEIITKIKRLFSSKDFSFKELLIDNYIPLICLLFAKDVFREIQGFDETFDIYEDWDMLIRIAGQYPFYHAGKKTVEYIQWSKTLQVSQTSEFIDKANEAHIQIIEKHREKFTADVIRGLIHNRRVLKEKHDQINDLERIVMDQKGHTENLVRQLQEREDYTTQLERMMQEREKHEEKLENAIREREKYIETLEEVIKERDRHVHGLGEIMLERESRLNDLEKNMKQKETEVAHYETVLNERDTRIAEFRKIIQEKENDITGFESAIQQKADQIAGLEKMIQENREVITKIEGKLSVAERQRKDLDNVLHEKEKQISDLNSTIGRKDAQITAIQQLAREKDNRINELEDRVRQKDVHIFNVERAKAIIEKIMHEHEATLNKIFHSRGWKGIVFYYKLRDTLLPPQTKRRALVKSSFNSMIRLLNAARDLNMKKFFKDSHPFPPEDAFSRKHGSKPYADISSLPDTDSREISAVTSGTELKKQASEERTRPVQESKITKGKGLHFKKGNVLIAGVYLANQENTIEHIVAQCNQSKNYNVTQRWIALFGDAPTQDVRTVTTMTSKKPQPKFVLLNKILSEEKLEQYDYVIICDDDIKLSGDFVDDFLDLQEKYDFALAQPARTHNSYIDHPFVEQFKGLKARRTRFVEIGPVVSIRKDAFSALLPFDASSPMGWGYDFVWPCVMEKLGLRMGIIDATPVDHSMRKPVKNYNYDEANKSNQDYLNRNPHLSKDEAFTILESYA